jgi:hypothetical protein
MMHQNRILIFIMKFINWRTRFVREQVVVNSEGTLHRSIGHNLTTDLVSVFLN